MPRKHCDECKKETNHVFTNPTGEVAARLFVGVLTMGMSETGMPKDREVECIMCGNLKTVID